MIHSFQVNGNPSVDVVRRILNRIEIFQAWQAKFMSFHNQNIIMGAIADLRDILINSQADPKEALRLIGQIEATVCEIDRKYSAQANSQLIIQTPAAPIIV